MVTVQATPLLVVTLLLALQYKYIGQVAMPDPKLTPGVVRTTSAKEVCSVTTKAFRLTTDSMKKQVCAAYGVKDCPHEGKLEIDHLISLELGGADDVRNLWPQPATPRPGYHEKDLVENFLHREVCAGHMTLVAAQKQIAENWLTVYEHMEKK